MGIKEKLTQFTIKSKIEEKIETISLDSKVDEFIDWYFKNMVVGLYTETGEYMEPKRMRNSIEKMAIWYEFRYPEMEIKRIFNSDSNKIIGINNIMFKYNSYINDMLGEDNDINYLDWNEFFNYESFLRSLSWEEKWMLSRNEYPNIVYIINSLDINNPHFHLDCSGNILLADDVDILKTKDGFVFCSEDFIGKQLSDALDILKKHGIDLKESNEIEEVINNYKKREYLKEEFLNCVMYRIIERGGSRIGPRRGFLFAKEFGRNIDIPMQYGIDRSDPNLRLFMNEYFKAGGKSDLECLDGYFFRSSDDDVVDTINMKKLIKTQKCDVVSFYTPEEDELHQRLARAIEQGINKKVKKLVK